MPKQPPIRTKPVHIRMYPDEHRRLLEAARHVGLPLGTWMRLIGLAEARALAAKDPLSDRKAG